MQFNDQLASPCELTKKMKRKAFIFYFSCLILSFLVKAVFADEKTLCLNHYKELVTIKLSVTEEGGIWSIYEKLPEIRPKSFEGLNLDGKINQIFEISKYLCQTLEGVPLNGLAAYVLTHLEKMGEKKFREQLIINRGKSEKEIQVWFTYAKIALKNLERKLDANSVIKSLNRAKKIIIRYRNFVNDKKRVVSPNDVLKNTRSLRKQIEKLIKTDSNLALAIYEKEQEPYWDIYGGDVG
tara:strand:- start:224 stop:940 length:717 start_codon:yes stop_codon:yes gene_type:complete